MNKWFIIINCQSGCCPVSYYDEYRQIASNVDKKNETNICIGTVFMVVYVAQIARDGSAM